MPAGYVSTTPLGALLDKSAPKITVDAFKNELPRVVEKLYNVVPTATTYEEFRMTAPTGFSGSVAELGGPPFDSPIEGQPKRIVPPRKGLGLYLSADLLEDAPATNSASREILAGFKWLGFSLRQSIESEGHAVLANEAFTPSLQSTADGNAIFSVDHEHADGSLFDNTWSAARALNEANAVAAINGIRGQGLGRGHRTGTGRGKLVLLTGDAQNHRAQVLLGTAKQVGTNNNDMNKLQNEQLTHINSPYIDGNFWGIFDMSGHGFTLVRRMNPKFMSDNVFLSQGRRFMGIYRIGYGNINNGLSTWATQGA